MLRVDPERAAFVHELEHCSSQQQLMQSAARSAPASTSTRCVFEAGQLTERLRLAGDERLAEAVAESFRVATALAILGKQQLTPAAARTRRHASGSDRALLALLIGTLAVLSPHRFAGGAHAASGLLATLVHAHAHLLQFLRQYLDAELLSAAGGAPNASACDLLFCACIRLVNDRCFDESTLDEMLAAEELGAQ